MSETTPQSTVTWENPPVKQRYDWDAVASQLRERPGEWAKLFDNDRNSLATAIRIGAVRALAPTKGFEVKTANNVRLRDENGKEHRLCSLWLRYSPEKDRGTN